MRRAPYRSLALAFAGACCAQQWRAIDGPGGIAAYDWNRGEFLSLGTTGELWAGDDAGIWQRPAPVPPAGWLLVHDPVRARTVGLCAINQSMLQTWEWDGASWRVRPSATTPRAAYPCAVWDTQRNAVLMLSANLYANYQLETWSWNGLDWQLLGTSGPSGPTLALGNFRMAHDPATGRTLLAVIRVAGSVQSAEFWEWDGTQWSLRTFAGGPTSCSDLAYDPVRQRTVLVGGGIGTWEYDAQPGTWQQRATIGYAGMVFARHRGRLVAGSQNSPFEWDGSTWTLLRQPAGAGSRLTLDPHSGRVFSFGSTYAGSAFTSEHDGFAWRTLAPANAPPPRAGHALWNDGSDVWLFGGRDATSAPLADTWRWNGLDWSPVTTAHSPSPRDGMAVAWNGAAQRAFAFGGRTANGLDAETWEFDGADWLQRSPAAGPPPRAFAAIAHDPLAGRTVMLHGMAPGGYLHVDSWQWNGQQWAPFAPMTAFSYFGSGAQAQAMTFDPLAGRLVFVNAGIPGFRVAEFTGSGWASAAGPPNVTAYPDVQVFPDARGNLMLHGSGVLFRRAATPSAAATFGDPCGRDLVLGARTWPTLGAPCAIELAGAPPNGLAVLLAALYTMSLPLGGGCTRLVPHTQWRFLLFADAAGLAALPLPIPADAALRGLVLDFQAVTLHGAAPGVAVSRGLRLTIGD